MLVLCNLILHHPVLETAPEGVQPLSAAGIPEYLGLMKSQNEELLSSWDAADEVIDNWENMHGEEQEVTSCIVEQIRQAAAPADEVRNFI